MQKNEAKRFASLILTTRRYQKMIQTYYIRVKNNLYSDGCIRGYFNHCSTETGRLTSDLQQVPRKDKAKIKQMFISRY